MRGVCLAVDVGRARIGVAKSDPHWILATPLETIARDRDANPGELDRSDLDRIFALIAEHDVRTVFVGLPLNLRGERTASTEDAAGFAQDIQLRVRRESLDVTVETCDERFTTTIAQRQMREVGKSSRASRGVIDQAAAVQILEGVFERARKVREGLEERA